MKNKISIKLSLFGIILITFGVFSIFYPRLKKQTEKEPATNNVTEEPVRPYVGEKLAEDELNYYKENITNIKNNISLYQAQYIYPKTNNNSTSSIEMEEQQIDENGMNRLLEFLSTKTPIEKLSGEIGWEPYIKVIHITYNGTNIISIHPLLNSFCLIFYSNDNLAHSFIFDEEQDIYDLVRSENTSSN